MRVQGWGGARAVPASAKLAFCSPPAKMIHRPWAEVHTRTSQVHLRPGPGRECRGKSFASTSYGRKVCTNACLAPLSAPPRAGSPPHAVNCPVARGPPAVRTTHPPSVSDSGVRGCAQAPVSPQCLGLCLHTIPAGRAEPQPPESGLPSLCRGLVGEEGMPEGHRHRSPGDGPRDPPRVAWLQRGAISGRCGSWDRPALVHGQPRAAQQRPERGQGSAWHPTGSFASFPRTGEPLLPSTHHPRVVLMPHTCS